MLHLLLVLKLVTGNANSWQTCDPRRTEKTNAKNGVDKNDRLRGKDERDSLKIKGTSIYTSGRGAWRVNQHFCSTGKVWYRASVSPPPAAQQQRK